jgi:hypothetical protein
MKRTLLIVSITIVFAQIFNSCGENSTKNESSRKVKKRTGNEKVDLWTDIKEAEDSMYSKQKRNRVSNVHYLTYFTKLIEYYKKYPTDAKADSCLLAICTTDTGYPIGHAKHIELQEQYGDTLIDKYPKSKYRIFALENLIYMHDQAIKNKRDTVKLKKYYNLLLDLIPKNETNKERINEIQNRIQNIDRPVKFG